MKEVTDANMLYEAFRAAMKGSAWKEEPQQFEINWLSEVSTLQKELETGTYKPLPPTEFIMKERGKTRYIHGGRMRDRVATHSFCDNELGPALQKYLIYNNGASQTGKGISFSRKQFEQDLHSYYLKYRTNEGYITFIDFSKYYDNILHEKCEEMILPKLSDDWSRWYFRLILKTFEVDVSSMTEEEIERAISAKFDYIQYCSGIRADQKTGEKYLRKSVDIGDQISQVIGIYYPTRIDNYVKIVRGVKYYGRYMDDAYFITRTKEEADSILEGIREQAALIGVFINEKKTHSCRLSERFKYLQIRYWMTDTGKIVKRINPKAVTRERRKLKAYKRILDRNLIEYDDIKQAYKSWMGAYYKLLSRQQRTQMSELYYSLFGKRPLWKKVR